jgi:hypothetical protein
MPETTSDHELALRVARLNPRWRLERWHGLLTLIGDGMPASFARTLDCDVWLARREQARADREALDAIRRSE